MKCSYLEITYSKGRPLAAYFYLPRRESDRSLRTERAGGGLLVDYAADGRAIGIEITAPSRLMLEQLNRLLERVGHRRVARDELAPLVTV
jgi:uncharacterized protein YuzE